VRATGQPLAQLMQAWLVEPLGLDTVQVLLDRHRGAMAAHCCLRARARDWLSLALLVAQQGEFGGRRVYSEAFAREIPIASPVAPGRALGLSHVDVGGSVPALVAAGPGRLLLIDADSRTAWLWFSRRDRGDAGLQALRNAAAQAAGRQPRA
jgi:CubicO group peptidase (beta-lactamase class C family)